jgi:hypothetical protein
MQKIIKRDLMSMAAAGTALDKAWRWLQEHGASVRWQCNAATPILANRFVDQDATTGLLNQHESDSDKFLGVAMDNIGKSAYGEVRVDGMVEVIPSHAIAAMANVCVAPEGFCATVLAAAHDLATAVAATDTDDDLVQTNLPDTLQAICAGDETGNTLIIYGDVGGVLTKETLTLGAAATYTTTNTWTAIYGIFMTAAATGTIDVEDGTGTGAIIATQIAGADPARFYGAIIPDASTDAKGLAVRVAAGGANTAKVVLYGTDYAGAEQIERVTMNGTTDVVSAKAWRTLTYILVGADGIAFGAGVTSQYDSDVAARAQATYAVGYAMEAQATAGKKVHVRLYPLARPT